MITVRRATQRQHEQQRKQEVWLTFSATNPGDPLADGFGVLEVLNEHRLPPGATLPAQPHRDALVVTFVREGALAYHDSSGRSGVIQAGEFQRMTAVRGNRHSETNASRTDWAHLFQIRLRPDQSGLEPSLEQRRFSAAQRRGLLCIIGSPDGRQGSLRIYQDALIYSAILEHGQHVVHALPTGRSAWLHLVSGAVTLGDMVLGSGDGAAITLERAVSVTARQPAEILLFDLGAVHPAAS